MTRPLKVWRARLYANSADLEAGPPEFRAYREHRRAGGIETTRDVVAAPSRAAAGRALGLRPHEFDGCCLGETVNADDVAIALSAPGVVFWKPNDYPEPLYARRRDS